MNKLKLAFLAVSLLFLLVTTFVDLPDNVNKILYTIMAVFSLGFLLIKRKDLNLDSMFDKKDTDQE